MPHLFQITRLEVIPASCVELDLFSVRPFPRNMDEMEQRCKMFAKAVIMRHAIREARRLVNSPSIHYSIREVDALLRFAEDGLP